MKSRYFLTGQKHVGPGPYSDQCSAIFKRNILEKLKLRDEILLVVEVPSSHCDGIRLIPVQIERSYVSMIGVNRRHTWTLGTIYRPTMKLSCSCSRWGRNRHGKAAEEAGCRIYGF
jgi:hypothetical protein